MSKLSDSIIDSISNEVGNAMDQLYDMSEQMRTGQTVYDRTQQDSLQHHQVEEKQPEQTSPEPQQDIEQDR